MRRVWKLIAWAGVGGLATLGCADPPKRATIKPPKEDFHVPPAGLFGGPIKYPNELLNNVEAPHKKDDDEKFPNAAAAGPTGGLSGMGGPGAGMGGAPH